ncbi:hypothetical protein BH10ACT8_BH10ACT8_30430 [soil metagenome]
MDLIAPSAYSSEWRCAQHGGVPPLRVYRHVDTPELDHVRERADVPLWMPDPGPRGWSLAGLGAVGDERGRLRATVTAFRGPAPLGGTGEWLIVAEEPAIGLGAAYSAAPGIDPVAVVDSSPPTKIHTRGQITSLWAAPSSAVDRSVYVGEAEGVWIWLISFPADAGYALLEDLVLADAREGIPPQLAVGTPADRMRPSWTA